LVAAAVVGFLGSAHRDPNLSAFDDWNPGRRHLSIVGSNGGRVQDTAPGTVRIPDRWVAGFVNDLGGETISYPSAYPGQTRALLTRATDGTRASPPATAHTASRSPSTARRW
jgi:hypothetical protein